MLKRILVISVMLFFAVFYTASSTQATYYQFYEEFEELTMPYDQISYYNATCVYEEQLRKTEIMEILANVIEVGNWPGNSLELYLEQYGLSICWKENPYRDCTNCYHLF